MPNPGLDPRKREQIASMLIAGSSPNEIVSELGVSHSSVSRVKASLPSDIIAKMNEEDITMITSLVHEQLKSGIEATIAISEQAKDKDWIKAQPANQLGVLYGVISDKSVRLLEAAENAALASAAEKSAEVFDLTGDEKSN